MAKAPREKKDDDVHQDAWQRFEKAVDAAIKSGPQHRPKKDEPKRRRPPKKEGE
jgi:hypothetical protein